MGRALWQRAVEVATVMGRRRKTVQDWQNPTAQMAEERPVHPVFDLQLMIEACLLVGVPREDALAPIHYLNSCFEQVTVRTTDFAIPQHVGDLTRCLPSVIEAFGSWTAHAARILADGKVTAGERRQLQKLQGQLRCFVGEALAVQRHLEDALKGAK